MAARKRLYQLESCREKIRTSQLINRLQDHGIGKLKVLTPTQVKALEILLRKVLPDMTETALVGADRQALPLVVFAMPVAISSEEWQKSHEPK